jgi:hypothetical protein
MSGGDGLAYPTLVIVDSYPPPPGYTQLNTAPVLDQEVPAAPEHHQGFRKVVFMLPGGFVLVLVGHPASDLEKWHNRLDELGIEHGRIAEDTFGFDYCCWVAGGAPRRRRGGCRRRAARQCFPSSRWAALGPRTTGRSGTAPARDGQPTTQAVLIFERSPSLADDLEPAVRASA